MTIELGAHRHHRCDDHERRTGPAWDSRGIAVVARRQLNSRLYHEIAGLEAGRLIRVHLHRRWRHGLVRGDRRNRLRVLRRNPRQVSRQHRAGGRRRAHREGKRLQAFVRDVLRLAPVAPDAAAGGQHAGVWCSEKPVGLAARSGTAKMCGAVQRIQRGGFTKASRHVRNALGIARHRLCGTRLRHRPGRD